MNTRRAGNMILLVFGLFAFNISLSQQVPEAKIQEWLELIKGGELGPEKRAIYSFSYEEKIGAIDTAGNVILPFKYDFVDGFYNGIAAVNIGGEYDNNSYPHVKGGKWGLVDSTGKEITAVEFDYVENNGVFYDLIPVEKEGKIGLIDRRGKNITPFKYDLVEYKTDDDVWMVSIKDSFYVEEELPHLGYPGYFYHDRRGLVDNSGEITEIKYNEIYFPFSNGKTKVSVLNFSEELGAHDQYGLIDTKGKELIQPEYEYLDHEIVDVSYRYFFDGLVMLKKEHKYGYANQKGKIVIPFEYDEAKRFNEGKASVSVHIKDEDGSITGAEDFQIDTKGKRIK